MFKAPRGTADRLPEEQPYWQYVMSRAEELFRRFGYQRIDTPVFEEAGLFERSVGVGTDIVTKEMYTFKDKGNEDMTLRPEGTAPVCRAYLEHGMHALTQPVRLYYFGPIFRYERPQAGRYRQHHQLGYEALGDADPAVDAEVIELAWRLYEGLGLKDITLQLNSIGCRNCRPGYLQAIRDYYRGREPAICSDCKVRMERNPLRLLDCKQPGCQPIIEGAPGSSDYLCQECREHFDKLRQYLKALGIPFSLSHRLVRGLDYYTRTVFEFQPLEEGGQSTIGGGGRYDGLMEELGGRPTPGVGFASGIERIVLNLRRQNLALPAAKKPLFFVACLGDEARVKGIELASQIRQLGGTAVLSSEGKSLKAQLRQASGLGAAYALILGEDELRQGTVVVRDMTRGQQEARKVQDFWDWLRASTTGPVAPSGR